MADTNNGRAKFADWPSIVCLGGLQSNRRRFAGQLRWCGKSQLEQAAKESKLYPIGLAGSAQKDDDDDLKTPFNEQHLARLHFETPAN